MFTWIVGVSVLMWTGLLVLPWRPWSTREQLHIEQAAAERAIEEITVLIPARNEAACIAQTLQQLTAQGRFARIIVIDDQSDDGTGEIAAREAGGTLEVIAGSSPAQGWTGKIWALEQGLKHCRSRYVLLLDADIGLRPGVVTSLLGRLEDDELDMASVMANLPMQNFWEKLLLPPFVYFFKLIYPFALSNSPQSRVAAGAGGCALLRVDKLRAIGGFAALKDAIIDDCTLARKIKALPGRLWIGLSNDARALRPYENLSGIWDMVARTAYTQLRYSPTLLIACTLLMFLGYVVPIVALVAGPAGTRLIGAIALLTMIGTYLPTVRYYGLRGYWALTLPAAAMLFLAMTWTSAVRYWRGERSRWKNRSYARAAPTENATRK
ncbi:MAG: glycosyltransferase [Gammaproteobacteria bacterium]|jgi:hopene-associated glycosyltransferase HpnB|nr:glycosyltransferase [Gammaproteobacteria bacterium]